jgi:hypothetical protein
MEHMHSSVDQMISVNSIVVASGDQVSSDLGEEAVILGLKTGVYYGLNPVGARIWSLVQQPRTVENIRDTVLAEYEVEPERCERDLLELLQVLLGKGLIDLRQ